MNFKVPYVGSLISRSWIVTASHCVSRMVITKAEHSQCLRETKLGRGYERLAANKQKNY